MRKDTDVHEKTPSGKKPGGRKKLIENFLSFSGINILNTLIPLLIYPYLVRVLGVEMAGLIAFSGSLVAYFRIVVEYGLSLVGARDLVQFQANKPRSLSVFSHIMWIRLLLLAASLAVGTVVIFAVPVFQKEWLFHVLFLSALIGETLYVPWVFQAYEQMKYATLSMVVSKVLFAAGVFWLIQTKADYLWYPILFSGSAFISGVAALYFIFRKFSLRITGLRPVMLKYYLVEGWYLFLSRLFVNLYNSTNILILGFFTNELIVGYYAIAGKVISAAISFVDILNQVLYPRLSQAYRKSKGAYERMLKQSAIIVLGAGLAGSLFCLVLSEWIVLVVAGEVVPQSVTVLQIISALIFLASIGSFSTKQFIIARKNKLVTRIVLITSVVNLVLVFIVVPFYGLVGLAVVSVVVRLTQAGQNLYELKVLTNELK
ncbi:flippase [Roseivirga sp. BDSF3-8]|uniref:flippase n=1 Tax=Roseivirga sp. BDSF3-8 TaxID=3241598 RepID=UPI00353278E6